MFRVRPSTLVILAAVGGCSVGLWMLVSRARVDACRTQCRSHLSQISLALANYQDVYGVLPTARTHLPDGRAAHSWRVMILPYWDRVALYDQYDMTVPWNDPANEPVSAYRTNAFFYGCPCCRSLVTGSTNYFAVVDETTSWPPDGTFHLSEVEDDPSETILVIESADSLHNWSAPIDPTLEELLARGPGDNHSKRVHAVFADRRVRAVRTDVSAETLRALLTVAGNEEIDANDWQVPWPE